MRGVEEFFTRFPIREADIHKGAEARSVAVYVEMGKFVYDHIFHEFA